MKIFEVVGQSLRAAIRYGDMIYPGNSHLDALSRMPQKYKWAAQVDGNNRGYVTARGKFLDRRQAQKYAVRYRLIRSDAPEWAWTAPELVSEFL